MNIRFIPKSQRNPYTLWFKYANKNLYTYNRIAMKYNMERLQAPLNIKY
jgi:hypothetical protein